MIPTPAEQPTMTVEEAGRWIGFGRSKSYEAAARGEIPTLRFGRTVRVPTAALRRMLGLDPEQSVSADSPDAAVVQMHPRGGAA